MESGKKRAKIAGNGGKGGGVSGGGGGGSSESSGGRRTTLRTGESDRPPSDLVLVGRILGAPSPEYHAASGGKMVKVHVETWMTDLYRSNQWWIELPNVEDVADVSRRKVIVRAMPLGAPTGSSPVGVANGSQGRMRMEGIKLALFGNRDGWDMIFGTPPAWFVEIWNKTKDAERESDWSEKCSHTGDRLADEFKNAKVYVTQAQVLQEQRDWLIV
mmetsp:Transcript_12188/g.21732  ORF Transcript_12188/g.21732 Transcript_12188/m.21732 type:complete len:216 (-) Transcript_12188:568-1215(-)